jgi:hypothetical protein
MDVQAVEAGAGLGPAGGQAAVTMSVAQEGGPRRNHGFPALRYAAAGRNAPLAPDMSAIVAVSVSADTGLPSS